MYVILPHENSSLAEVEANLQKLDMTTLGIKHILKKVAKIRFPIL